MNQTKINNLLFKTIGFTTVDSSFSKSLVKQGFKKKEFDSDTLNFLQKSYHSEYLNLMFNTDNKGVEIFSKKIDYKIEINSRESEVILSNIDLYIFNDTYENSKTSIFSITYKPSINTLQEISNISHDLKDHNCEIIYNSEIFSLKEFISKELFFGHKFSGNNTPLEQYSGSRFKNYLVVDFDHKSINRDQLLYELGTCSMLGTIEKNTIQAPSELYVKDILENKISCFKNYDCLTLYDSFTVIGTNNYDENHPYTSATWNDIYFSIYIFNLYVKSSLQILLNDFTSDAMEKRKEFQEFYNKYYFKKISYNFLPNEIFKRISISLEIEEDLNFIKDRLETLALQINEKQQKQQEFLLLCISITALLETPLFIDGIRQIIGINNTEIYNSLVYGILVLIILILVISRFKKK